MYLCSKLIPIATAVHPKMRGHIPYSVRIRTVLYTQPSSQQENSLKREIRYASTRRSADAMVHGVSSTRTDSTAQQTATVTQVPNVRFVITT